MNGTGAILAGRRWYDVATRKYGGRSGIYGGTGSVRVDLECTSLTASGQLTDLRFLVAKS